jgi:serine/threonine-protein kinase
MAQAGTVLGGRYVLEDQIGNGGYGEVWRATDTVLARPVAVKLLHPRYTQRNEALARFRAEARHAGALSHENIAQVFDYGEPADGQPPYLVMELVDGPSLETVLTGGPLDDRQTMDIVAQAAAGLQAAHAAGMIHRDIKPGNLLLTPGGTVKITDFGIAHTIGSAPVTASGELIGTPGYLAPERAMGERATPASDLYSLGMVAYECLAGTPPFRGTALEVALAHRDRPLPPLPPSVAVGVCALVMRLAAKDPARRLNEAAEVAVWAGLLRDGVGVAAIQMWPEQPPVAGLFQRRTVLAYACVAVTAVVVIVLASVIGFASTPGRVTAGPASAPAPAPVSSSHHDVTAPPAGRHPARPVTNPRQQPAASPVAKRKPAGAVPAAVMAAVPAPGPGPAPGKGPGKAPGKGPGKAPGQGDGTENGAGNGNGQGNGNGEGD